MRKKLIVVINVLTLIMCITYGFSQASENYTKIDADNSKGTSYWKNIPIVSKELLENEEVTIGGEGCQWPLSMATSSDGKYLFYGTDVGGLYRSTDNGKTWDKSMKNYTASGAADIIVDPNNSNRVIVFGVNGTPQYTTGIYLSEDGGETWKFKQNFMISGYRDVSENMAYDASSYDKNLGYSTTAYVSLIYKKEFSNQTGLELTDTISDSYTDGKSACNKAGLYKTEDGGNTWNMISNTLYDGIVKVNPITGTVYIAKEDGLYISTNKGESFDKINSKYILGLDIIKIENNAKIYYTTDDGVYCSEDNGKTFTQIKSNNFPSMQNRHPQNIKVSPVDSNNMVMYFGEELMKNGAYNIKGDVYYTSDGGKNWSKSTYNAKYNFMRNNLSAMERVPNFIWSVKDKNRVWDFQNDWISSSYNGGKEFRWDANGLNAMLVGGKWHFNLYNSNIIYLSSQDYNGAVTLDGGKTWKYVDLSAKSITSDKWNSAFIYGGYASDEKTYFGGVSSNWTSTKYLTITHDGGKTHTSYLGNDDYALTPGKDNRLLQQRNYSSYQSLKDKNILFCANLRSTDNGYTWSKMVDENSETAVTGVYTHDSKTGRLFGINDFTGWVMYSDDDGATWQKYNKESLNKWQSSPYLETLSYDSKNDKLYVAWGWTQLSVITDEGNTVTNITENIPKMLQFEDAPTKEQIGSNYCERRIRCVAVDPNNPDIIYAGGGSYTYQGDSSLYRSCDGGKTWKVVSINGTNSIVSTKNGDYGGVEPTCINVKPDTGELWASGNCTGLSKLTPPYAIKQNSNENNTVNNPESNEINNTIDNTINNIINDTTNNTAVDNTINNNVNNTTDNKINNTVNDVVNDTINNTVNNNTINNSDNKNNTEVTNTINNIIENNTNKINNEKNNNIKNKTNNSTSNNSGTESNNIINKIYPFTGKKQYMIYAIIISCIISNVLYIKYKKTNK